MIEPGRRQQQSPEKAAMFMGRAPPEKQPGLSPHPLLSSPHEGNNDFSDEGF